MKYYVLLLQHEIEMLNDEQFKRNVNWLQMLTQLIEESQDQEGSEVQEMLQMWMEEREQLR